MNNDWKYVPFSDVFDWCQKSDIGSREGNENGKYPLYIASATEIKHYNDYLENGEALVFGTGGNPCIHFVTGKFAYTNHTEAAKKRDIRTCTKFYYYYFQKDKFSLLQSTFIGGGIKNSSKRKIGALPVPIIETAEQERIVSRIEEMFSQLDASVGTLKKTKAQLAIYRQAVLKEAFSRCSEKKTIREMSSVVTSGSRGWAKYYSDNGAKFIRIGNLTRNKIIIELDDVQNVRLPENAEGTRTKLEKNDVLVSITADLGSIGLVPADIGEAYVNQHIAMIRFNNANQGEFYAWYLRSEYGQRDLLKNKRGGGKLGLGLDDIRDSNVPVVSNETAKNILSGIETRFSVCDNIEQTIDMALQQAETIRQSILKDAFQGRL